MRELRSLVDLFTFLWFLWLIGWVHGAESRPNLIFVMTDDQRWDAMGVVQREQGELGRFPWLKTPAMDRMAAEGVRFRNAFDTLSLCSPSRAALLTGRYNHLNGIVNNSTPFGAEHVTHATLLRDAGYATAYVGKWHMGQQHGQRPGFDYSASFVGQGKYFDCPFEVNGAVMPTQGWVDDVSTDFAIRWLEQKRDQPFLMVLGYKSPHSPRGGDNLPPRLRGLYTGEKSRAVPNIGVLPVFRQPNPEKPLHQQGLVDQQSHLDYMRHITGADENLGHVLDALDRLKLTDNTVVVYSSDNGYYLGEHGSGDKRSAYDESLRIPLLVRWPGHFPAGSVVDEMVLNLDLAPTLLELAGQALHGEMQGASWAPLAMGRKVADWRQSFLFQYYKELGDVPTLYGVRTATWKLVVYPGRPQSTEVYDLAADPYEIRNLSVAGRAPTELRDELQRQVIRSGYLVPD